MSIFDNNVDEKFVDLLHGTCANPEESMARGNLSKKCHGRRIMPSVPIMLSFFNHVPPLTLKPKGKVGQPCKVTPSFSVNIPLRLFFKAPFDHPHK